MSRLERVHRPGRRALSVTWRLALGLLVALLLAEAALRLVLFADVFDGTRLAARLRRPDLYAEQRFDDLYWLLLEHFQPKAQQRGPMHYDEKLGWTSGLVQSETYLHAERGLLAGRRPVLLFGDSYAQCVTDSDDCFAALLERTDLARGHYLLNYGVGGFGLDQVLLLLRSSIDLYRELDPIVIVGIFVDDDFDRCALSFREWPKPRMQLRDGGLVLEQAVVPTYDQRVEQSYATSLLWKLLARRSGSPALGRATRALDDHQAELRRVAAAILDAILVELETRGLDHVVALFDGPGAVEDPSLLGWRPVLARDVLERRGTRFVDVGAAMRERVARTGEHLASFYGTPGAGGGHYNATGNQIAFDAIADGLTRSFGTPPAEPFVSPRDIARVVSTGPESFAQYASAIDARFTELEDRARLLIGVGEDGPTEVHYDLAGRARSFRARVRFVPQGKRTVGSVGFCITADGERLFERTLLRSEPALEIDVPLAGRSSLVIRAVDASEGAAGEGIIVLSAPRFD